MFKAWQKGVSPYEYRKCLQSDMNFIQECERSIDEKAIEKQHQEKVNQVMQQMRNGR